MLCTWREALRVPGLASPVSSPLARIQRQKPPLRGPEVAKVHGAVLPGGPKDVGWQWPARQQGGELHREVSQVMQQDRLPAPIQEVLSLVLPEPARCGCALERWDQYALCREIFTPTAAGVQATTAISLGINKYDIWAHTLQERHHLVPRTFDCFAPERPIGFPSEFRALCVGPKEELRDGRRYTTLQKLLHSESNQSVLLKMDIEGTESDVLWGFDEADWARINSLHVEYHLNFDCAEEQSWFAVRSLLERVRENLVAVDAAVVFYAPECRLSAGQGGSDAVAPKLLAVSYMAESACGGGKEDKKVQASSEQHAKGLWHEMRPGQVARVKVGTSPHADLSQGGELWRDMAAVLKEASREGGQPGDHNHSSRAVRLLQLAAPEPGRCPCLLERWDQYALCTSALAASRHAMSIGNLCGGEDICLGEARIGFVELGRFSPPMRKRRTPAVKVKTPAPCCKALSISLAASGINGYDAWGWFLFHVHGIVPRTLDCFNTNKPADFKSDFSPLCLGSPHGRPSGNFTSLQRLLEGTGNASVLLKLDLEAAEYEVLLGLQRKDWLQIGALHVTYHLDFGCLDDGQWFSVQKVLEWAKLNMAVVDSVAVFYPPECSLDTVMMPKRLFVSYAQESVCQS